MANTSSAKKAKRQGERRRVFNLRRKKDMKDGIKAFEKKPAAAALPSVFQAIDKASKNGTIKPNTAARMKSRLAKLVK